MNHLRILFFIALFVLVIVIARRNSTRNTRARATAAPAPVAQPANSATPAGREVAAANPTPGASAAPIDFKKVAEHVAPAVALISTFDASGKLLHSGSGIFVAQDGQLLTTDSLIEGAAHAVAKVSDGRIINIDGILAHAPDVDLALLKVDTKKGVPVLIPDKSGKIDNGTPVAVVGSTLMHRNPPQFDRLIAQRGSDAKGDYFSLSAPLPEDCLGAPVVNANGDVVGIVTSQGAPAALGTFARGAAAAQSVVAHVEPRAVAAWADQPPPPAEGPSPPRTRVAKIPVVQADSSGVTKLLYSPKPKYPATAQRSNIPLQGEGRYRVRFAANGQVEAVEVLQSTSNPTLDNAAVATLRQWKATPGQQWSATVPISFTP